MKRKFLASVTAVFAVFLIYSSCTRVDTTTLGSDLIPAIDNINTFDTTLSVISNNLRETDTTTMIYTELHALGIIDNDPEFGRTESHFYTSFVPSAIHTYPFVKRDSVKIDSVILSLSYGGLYGDSTSQQEFEVREIAPTANFSDTGYQIDNPDLDVRPLLLGSAMVDFRTLNDSTFYKNPKDVTRSIGELRIKLDTVWARHFVAYDTTAGDAYNNDSIFMERFPGIEIKPTETSPVKRALAYFKLTDNSRTRITFYCRVQNNGRTDTIAPYFIYSNSAPQANFVRRDPANGYLANLDNAVDNDEMVYLQSTPGSYISVDIPDLSTLDNRVIHRAELIMDKAPSAQEDVFTPPTRLFVQAKSGDSSLTIRNDFVLLNSSTGYDLNLLGGTLKSNKYVFNLSRYVQGIVTKGYRNHTLKISSPFTVRPYYVTASDVTTTSRIPIVINSTLAGGRVVLYGGNAADLTKRMRLHIIYSRLKP